MKTLTFKCNVHLSPKFGGIEHGEKIGTDISRGATHEIESDELADYLIKQDLADEIKVETQDPAKGSKKKTGAGAAAAILLLLGLLLGFTPSARADLFSYKTVQFTNSVSGPLSTSGQVILTANQVLTINSDPIPLAAKRGLGLWSLLQCSGASTQSNTNSFDVATIYGGVTNWTTTHPIQIITTANGATLVVNYQNVSDAILNNATLIRWATAANGATPSTNWAWGSYSTYAP